MSRGVAVMASRARASRMNRFAGVMLTSLSETFETMSGKVPGAESESGLGPCATRRPARRVEASTATAGAEVPVVQEKVLAEIAHELGNFFHKLYYWSDYLKERPGRQSADLTAAQMLESTIRNLEGFLKVSLDYFHPMPLAFTRMPVPDLVEGLLFQVRSSMNGTPITVTDEATERGADMLVDPGQLSRAFEVTVRHLTKHVSADSDVRVDVRRAMRGAESGLEVGFRLLNPNDASPLFRTAEAGVEWALAQKVVALHGGALEEHVHGQGGRSVVIFLPLCSA